MTIEPGKEYKIYYAGKTRRARVTAIIKSHFGQVSIAWQYYMGFMFQWSSENVDSLDEFKRLLGEQIDKIEI